MHTTQGCGTYCPALRASSSCGELIKELYRENYTQRITEIFTIFLGATEHVHVGDFSAPFFSVRSEDIIIMHIIGRA